MTENNQEPNQPAAILLVEDNEFNRLFLAKQLASLGYECDQAQDGKAALNLFLQKRHKVVITDCFMPVMDGFELANRIRQSEDLSQSQKTKIIALTGERNLENRCTSSGMDFCLLKPIQLAKLKDLMEAWYE